MGVVDPVDALQIDQALFLRLAGEQARAQRERQLTAGRGQMPGGLRGETPADLPTDPGSPKA